MRTSEHFNLNLVEGTDLVNPLTQDVPNYEAIDAAMFANQSASIGTATELKTGSIHALTRANANTNVFRFTATSRFTSGDTMTVDGVSVTVTAPNGTALVDGAYIIGSTVLCSLVGQLLTIYTVANAPDAEKLQGHDADYFATSAGLAQAQSLAENAAQVAQTTSEALTNIFKTKDTLFEGPLSKGSEFQLSASVNNYKVIRVIDLSELSEFFDIIVDRNAPTLLGHIVAGDESAGVMVMVNFAATTSDGQNYNVVRSSQVNVNRSGVPYLSFNQSIEWRIIGLR